MRHINELYPFHRSRSLLSASVAAAVAAIAATSAPVKAYAQENGLEEVDRKSVV